jgi:LmbE family N-acetylglucosaminyl deacetylase
VVSTLIEREKDKVFVSEQEQNKVAMVIFAHPDDAEFGCAGTVALWAREGWDVYYVVCTDGAGGGPDEATDVSKVEQRKVVETRKHEQRAAGEILGIKDVVFLNYPDGELEPSIPLRRDLVRILRRYRPTRVICQSPDRIWSPSIMVRRYHPDHLAAGVASLAAIYPASQNPWAFPELMDEGLLPHKVSEIYITGAPAVNYAVDISTTIQQKLDAIRAHSSQVGDHYEQLQERIRKNAADQGAKHDMPYAEEFHRTENT